MNMSMRGMCVPGSPVGFEASSTSASLTAIILSSHHDSAFEMSSTDDISLGNHSFIKISFEGKLVGYGYVDGSVGR